MEFEFHILAATCMEFLLIIFSAGNNIFFLFLLKKIKLLKKIIWKKRSNKKTKEELEIYKQVRMRNILKDN